MWYKIIVTLWVLCPFALAVWGLRQVSDDK